LESEIKNLTAENRLLQSQILELEEDVSVTWKKRVEQLQVKNDDLRDKFEVQKAKNQERDSQIMSLLQKLKTS
jgi:hypothetical protein